MREFLEIGKISCPHGITGEVKVIPLTDNPERFYELKWVYLDNGKNMGKYNISGVKIFKNQVILKFAEVKDRNTAETLRGAMLNVDRKNAVKLPKDSFFICDLIGCEVFSEDGERYGVLTDVLKTGSNDVYVVKCNNGKDILIPALKSVVTDVSIKDKRITVALPQGLLDD